MLLCFLSNYPVKYLGFRTGLGKLWTLFIILSFRGTQPTIVYYTHHNTLKLTLLVIEQRKGCNSDIPFNQTETGQSSENKRPAVCHLFILAGHLISPVVQCSQQSFLRSSKSMILSYSI